MNWQNLHGIALETLHGVIPGNSYWNKYGLQAMEVGTNNYMTRLKEQLLTGGYAMIWINKSGTYIGKSGETWATPYQGGNSIHWIAIVDHRENNGTFQMCTLDWRGQRWVDLDEFIWGISKMVFVSES